MWLQQDEHVCINDVSTPIHSNSHIVCDSGGGGVAALYYSNMLVNIKPKNIPS